MSHDTLTDAQLGTMLNAAHIQQQELLRPVVERYKAAQAICAAVMAAAEYRAQRDALAVRVAALEEENRRLRAAYEG